ncbi:hypothetical protein ACP70R_000204 [Stipagrostis hirtigluma subsp. patula]
MAAIRDGRGAVQSIGSSHRSTKISLLGHRLIQKKQRGAVGRPREHRGIDWIDPPFPVASLGVASPHDAVRHPHHRLLLPCAADAAADPVAARAAHAVSFVDTAPDPVAVCAAVDPRPSCFGALLGLQGDTTIVGVLVVCKRFLLLRLRG